MSRPRHIRDAQLDREARRAALWARWDHEDDALRAAADSEIRRRQVEREAQTPVERDAADRRLFERYGGPLAIAICVFGAPIADTIARSLHVL